MPYEHGRPLRPLSQAFSNNSAVNEIPNLSTLSKVKSTPPTFNHGRGDEHPWGGPRLGTVRTSPSFAVPSAKASPLPWQRRPDSFRSGSPGSIGRPASLAGGSSLEALASVTKFTAVDSDHPSRAEIAGSLHSKNPSWFKQTEDRGRSSPAYRQTHDEASSETNSSVSKFRLPGMSSESADNSSENTTSSPTSAAPSTQPATRNKVPSFGSTSITRSTSGTNSLSGASVLPSLNSQRLQSILSSPTSTPSGGPDELSMRGRTPMMSPSQGRIGTQHLERTPSPTKGLGGFVQSAMLKRSDSMNKRWSTQSVPRRSRENSVSSRGDIGGSVPNLAALTGFGSTRRETRSRPNVLDGFSEEKYHDESRQSSANPEDDGDTLGDGTLLDGDCSRLPLPSGHTRSQSLTEWRGDAGVDTEKKQPVAETPPGSPSKTLDQRRWSPTKASWLESALNKSPEPPKMKMSISQQPVWMSGISRTKQKEGPVDRTNSKGFQEVKTSGLMRAPATADVAKPAVTNRFSRIEPLSKASNEVVPTHESTEEKLPIPADHPVKAEPIECALNAREVSHTPEARRLSVEPDQTTHEPVEKNSPSVSHQSPNSELSPLTNGQSTSVTGKPKPPTPPKKDFRSVLKSRQISDAHRRNEEPEFKNVFGKLRHTTPQKYVAPDALKDNILRGKAGLSITGGPKKSERKDEFKESILKQKEAMKAKAAEQESDGSSKIIPGRTNLEGHEPATPEPLTRRANLVKSGSGSGTRLEPVDETVTPEAIARQKTLKEKSKIYSPSKDSITSINSTEKEIGGTKRSTGTFSSNLAGLLAKGPPSNMPRAVDSSDASSLREQSGAEDESNQQTVASGGPLTHMTKSRARGPKRRPPVARDADDDRLQSANIPMSGTPSEGA